MQSQFTPPGTNGFWSPNVVVALMLILHLQIVAIYDVVALMMADQTWTISYVIKSWSRDFPVLPLVVGVLMGHLFWPVSHAEIAPINGKQPTATITSPSAAVVETEIDGSRSANPLTLQNANLAHPGK